MYLFIYLLIYIFIITYMYDYTCMRYWDLMEDWKAKWQKDMALPAFKTYHYNYSNIL